MEKPTSYSNEGLLSHCTTDDNGASVKLWAESCDMTIICNGKLPKSFNTEIWKKVYNSDFLLAWTSLAGTIVMDPIPHTQHRPICVTVNPVVVTPFRTCCNPKKRAIVAILKLVKD